MYAHYFLAILSFLCCSVHTSPPNMAYIVLIFFFLLFIVCLSLPKWRFCEDKDLHIFPIREYLLNKQLLSGCICTDVKFLWHANSLQLSPTLCDHMDYNPPGSSVHGILQARILQWVAMSSSKGSS